MALAERSMPQSGESLDQKKSGKKPDLKVVESKPKRMEISARLKKNYENIVDGDTYDAELSIDEYTQARKDKVAAQKAKDEEALGKAQSELNRVVDDMNIVLKKMVLDNLSPKIYGGGDEPDMTLALKYLKEKGSYRFLQSLKGENWREDFRRVIEEDPKIFSEYRLRANKVNTKKRMEAARSKIAGVQERKANENLEKGIAKAKSLDELIDFLQGVDSIETSSGKKIKTKDFIRDIEIAKSMVSEGEKPLKRAMNVFTRNFGLRDKVEELIDLALQNRSEQIENESLENELQEGIIIERELEIAGVKTLSALIRQLKKYDKLFDSEGREYGKDEVLKTLNIINKKDVRPGSPLVAFLPNVYGMKDLVYKVLESREDERRGEKDRAEVAQMKKDVKLLEKILNGKISEKKWANYGEYDFKIDKSGRVRYKNAGLSGVPGAYLSKVIKANLQAELDDKKGFLDAIKKGTKGQLSEAERVEVEDAEVLYEGDKSKSYEELAQEAKDRFGVESLVAERKQLEADEKEANASHHAELLKDLEKALEGVQDFGTLYKKLEELRDLPYEDGSILPLEEVLPTLKHAELSKNRVVKRLMVNELPAVLRQKMIELFEINEALIDDSKEKRKELDKQNKVKKAAEKQSETYRKERVRDDADVQRKVDKGEKYMKKEMGKASKYAELNEEIRTAEERIIDLLDLQPGEVSREQALKDLRQLGVDEMKSSEEYSSYFDSLSRQAKKSIKKISKKLEKLEKKAESVNYDFDSVEAGKEMGLDVVELDQLREQLKSMTADKIVGMIEKEFHVDVENSTESERETINKLYETNQRFREMYQQVSREGVDAELERESSKEMKAKDKAKPKKEKKSFFKRLFG